jgi:soluble lytic murein transglycosylase-like protein
MMSRLICISLLLAFLCASSASSASAQDAGTLRRAARYEALMIEASARHGVDPRLLWTIAYLESRFRPDRVSHAGARGMMQFMPVTAARFNLDDPHDPAASIDAAARYLHELQTVFGHRLDLILAAYNAGENAVIAFRDGRKLLLSNGKAVNPKAIKTGGVPPYRETCAYVNDGIALYLRLAGRREWPRGLQIAKYQRLKIPEGRPLEKSSAPTPEEITQLKQGSIYVLDSSADKTTAPHLPPNATARSIYVQ